MESLDGLSRFFSVLLKGYFKEVHNNNWAFAQMWHKEMSKDDLFKATLPETNTAPENWWLADYFSFGKACFQRIC